MRIRVTFMLVGALIVVLLWALTLHAIAVLPNTVPIHLDGAGHIDAYGSKHHMLALPAVATTFWVAFAFLSRKPTGFNYPFRIRSEAQATADEQTRTMVAAISLPPLAIFLRSNRLSSGPQSEAAIKASSPAFGHSRCFSSAPSSCTSFGCCRSATPVLSAVGRARAARGRVLRARPGPRR